MTIKRSARILCLFCCIVCLFYCSIPSVYAFDPASAITSAGALASSLSLGEIGLFVLAGSGVIYGVQHAQEIGRELETVLNEAAQAEIQADLGNAEATAQITGQLGDWIRDAASGLIRIESAPAWIRTCIDYWTAAFSTSSKQVYTEIPKACFAANVAAHERVSIGVATSKECTVPTRLFAFWSFPGSYSSGHQPYYQVCLVSVAETSFQYKSGYSWVNADASFVSSEGRRYWIRSYSSTFDDESTILSLMAGAVQLEPSVWSDDYIMDLIKAYYGGTYSPTERSVIAPDVVIGGYGSAVGQVGAGAIDNPDIAVPAAGSIGIPVEGVSEGAAVYSHAIAAALAASAALPAYWDLVGVASPITGVKYPSIPYTDVETQERTGVQTITDTGISDDVIPVAPPVSGDYTLDLKDFFPFCIPFDIYDFFSILAAEPEAPQFEWDMEIPMLNYTHHWEIDLSEFDTVAQIVRGLFCLLFIVGLGAATGKFIKW